MSLMITLLSFLLFVCLAVSGVDCGMWDLSLQHMDCGTGSGVHRLQ